jgi:hypothetical protein
MAIDERHEIHPQSGFAVDKKTGVPVGLVGMPHLPVSSETEFPKWVTPHDSHVVMQGINKITPHFPEFHVDRSDQSVTVMVKDTEEEAKALAAKVEPKAEEPKGEDPGPT